MVQVCSEFAKEYPLYEMTQPPHFFDNYPAVNNKPVTKVDTNYTMNPFQNNGGSSERDQYINKIRKKCTANTLYMLDDKAEYRF